MIILILFALVGVCALAIFLVDFFVWFRTWSSRIKIGRYSSVSGWILKSEQVVNRWIKRMPTVKMTDSCRYILLDMVKGKYRNRTIQSWQIAGLMVGMDEDTAHRVVDSLIDDRTGQWLQMPKENDYALLAYEVMKCAPSSKNVMPAMEAMAEVIQSKRDGSYIWYRDHTKGTLYVDTVGFVSPFLVLYGKCTGDSELIQLGLQQIQNYYDVGMLPNVKVPCHCYDVKKAMPLGVYGWGRGLGWFLIGVIEAYLQLDDSERAEWLRQIVLEMAETVLQFQHQDGGLGSMLAIDSSYDSSITAIAGYYLMKCNEIHPDDRYVSGANKCMGKLMSVTRRNGALDICQGDTKGIGMYSATYDIMPFAQGFALALAKMLDDN